MFLVRRSATTLEQHFSSLWVHLSLQYNVLHLYGNTTTPKKERELSSVQDDTLRMTEIIKKKAKNCKEDQHFSKCPQILPTL